MLTWPAEHLSKRATSKAELLANKVDKDHDVEGVQKAQKVQTVVAPKIESPPEVDGLQKAQKVQVLIVPKVMIAPKIENTPHVVIAPKIESVQNGNNKDGQEQATTAAIPNAPGTALSPFYHDPKPPMWRHAPAKYFIPPPGEVNPDPFRPRSPSPEVLDLTNLPLKQRFPQDFKKFWHKFEMIEVQYVGQVKMWIRDIIEGSKLNDNQKYYWLGHLWSLSVQKQELWEKEVQKNHRFREEALKRLHEIIYTVLQEIRELDEEEKLAAIRDDEEPMTTEESRRLHEEKEAKKHPELTDLDDPTNALRGNVRKWRRLPEFSRMLQHQFGEDVRPFWSPIVQMHFGTPLLRLADAAFWAALE